MDRAITERQAYADGNGALWVVTDVAPEAGQITLRGDRGITRVEPIDAFQRKVVEGVYRLKSATSSEAVRRPQDLLSLTPTQREMLVARKRIVDIIQN